MREIKIRGYAVEKMVKSQWMYGFGLDYVEFADHYAKEVGRNGDWYLYTESGVSPVYKESIGQYTGLKDKNGVEIYEGDIIKKYWESINGNTSTFYPQVFQDQTGAWVFRYPNGTADNVFHTRNQIEVVGNIYENPELLGGHEHD